MTTSLTWLKYSCYRYKTFFWKVRHVFPGKKKKRHIHLKALNLWLKVKKKKIILAFKVPFSRWRKRITVFSPRRIWSLPQRVVHVCPIGEKTVLMLLEKTSSSNCTIENVNKCIPTAYHDATFTQYIYSVWRVVTSQSNARNIIKTLQMWNGTRCVRRSEQTFWSR